MKKILSTISVICVLGILGVVLFGIDRNTSENYIVTKIEILNDAQPIDSVKDSEVLEALMYRVNNGKRDEHSHGFVSQFINANFETYITGATTSIPVEKQKIDSELISSMAQILTDLEIDSNLNSKGIEHKIDAFYQDGTSIIINIDEVL